MGCVLNVCGRGFPTYPGRVDQIVTGVNVTQAASGDGCVPFGMSWRRQYRKYVRNDVLFEKENIHDLAVVVRVCTQEEWENSVIVWLVTI